MGVQQASLFNLPPEEPTPAGKKALPRENTTDQQSSPGEAITAGPDQDKIVTPAIVFNELVQAPAGAMEDDVTAPESEASIIVDEQVRELELVVSKTKVSAPAAVTGKKSTRGRIKLSDMDNLVDLVDVPADDVLFQKRYYSIGNVSDMFKVNISLIRFWENEFDILKPKKNAKGDRLFRPEDIKNLQLIYHLLREKKYTIDGAKDFLKNNKKAEESFGVIESLKKIKSFLLELKANL